MKIDSHQHFWKYDPIRDSWIDGTMATIRRDFLPNDLHGVLKKNNVDGCVAVQADQSEEETEFLLRLAEENSFIKGVVGWVDLCAPNVDERLGHFSKNPYFKGVRHILQAEKDDFILQESFQNGIAQLKKHNLSYDILVLPNQLKNSINLVECFPEQQFVLDHLAKPYIKEGKIDQWKTEIKTMAKFPNVYCKLSGMVTEADWNHWKAEDLHPYIEVVLDNFEPERIMYGSDWPVCLLAGQYKEVLGVVKDYVRQYAEDDQKAILGGTATKFYKLSA